VEALVYALSCTFILAFILHVWVCFLHGSGLQDIETRIAAYSMVPVENGELLQVLR
jgi:hypothetical protein